MKTFHIIIYGCQMNYSDAARIKNVLLNCGWIHVDNKEQADVVILDTCSVRQKSEDKVRGQLTELRADQKVWLTGCMIQHNLNLKKTRTTKSKKYTMGNFVDSVKSSEPMIVGIEEPKFDEKLKAVVREFALGREDVTDDILYINHAFNPLFKHMNNQFPNVELFFRINDVGYLPYVMRKFGYEVNVDVDVVNEYTGIIPHNANMLFKENTKTAYVPISTGCSQFCAYCIVPYARGLEKHRPIAEIFKEVEVHLEGGAQEIVLLGQIVNKHPEFYTILDTISSMSRVKWLRYTSPYPTFYEDKTFLLHQDRANICPHIHMPLQSGSNKVLKKMFRGYTREEFMEFVSKVRGLDRPISITSDVIVGFCDETEEDFLETLEVVKQSEFDMVYIGIYSPRPGTYGAKKYEDNVPMKVKKERWNRLNEVLKELSMKNNKEEIGSVRDILVREVDKDIINGYSDNMKNVIINRTGEGTSEIKVGQFLSTKIVEVKSFSLFGEVVE